MLKQRVITALILAPLAIWGVFALSNNVFSIVLGLIMAMAAWEWSRLAGLEQAAARAGYAFLVMAVIAGLFLSSEASRHAFAISAVAVLWWLMSLVWILRYPAGGGFWRSSALARGLAGLLVLVPAWASVAALQNTPGPGYVVLLMALIWGADTGAYFAGRRWGQRKMAPRVSPGKTWAGVGGALALTALVGLVGGWALGPAWGLGPLLILSLVTVAFSIVGDLVESMFKRLMDVKDSGGLLPGHGGVLDRIDSLTAAAPVFLVGLYCLENLG